MTQEIEIEFKNLLTKKEFDQLIEYFQISDTMFTTQINHYFDTDAFALKEQASALRIRQKDFNYQMTLKQPAKEGLLETNQSLNEVDALSMLDEGLLPDGPIKEVLMKIDINPLQLRYFGSLTTKRAECKYQNGLLAFDHSVYLNIEDFELEYEVDDYQKG